MSGITRVSDISVGTCGCCCPDCPHPWVSVHVQGSPDIYANGRSVMRMNDIGSSSCPHCSTSWAVQGSSNVFANKRPVHRLGDVHLVGCGSGVVVSASQDVLAN